MAEKEKIPEWDLFKRLEEVENLWIKETDNLEEIRKKINDAISLGILDFAIAGNVLRELRRPKKFIEMMRKYLEHNIKDEELRKGMLHLVKVIENEG